MLRLNGVLYAAFTAFGLSVAHTVTNRRAVGAVAIVAPLVRATMATRCAAALARRCFALGEVSPGRILGAHPAARIPPWLPRLSP
jgi:hypothetical protein